ncbi:MAG TPA: hypothetical protein VMO78_03905 [Rhizomicrobium sp.]|nr:hypothetical protein [Rhizomicrobium sp.]
MGTLPNVQRKRAGRLTNNNAETSTTVPSTESMTDAGVTYVSCNGANAEAQRRINPRNPVTAAGISQPFVLGIFYKTNRRDIARFRGDFYLSQEGQPEKFDALLRVRPETPHLFPRYLPCIAPDYLRDAENCQYRAINRPMIVADHESPAKCKVKSLQNPGGSHGSHH